ncbi:MAG: threonine/serine exporter family protein [Lachnospiraceae bacterium]|nr:threonine/serine exporter family protein [Lachnospiraceae bacterium]
MRDIDYIIDFAAHFGRELLFAGANLERANNTMERICKTYSLHEVSIFSLSSNITLSAKTADGETHIRQVSVPGPAIHLTKLTKLSRLANKVCEEAPEPKKLQDMLYEAIMVPSYGTWIDMGAFVLAITCLCRIFGGNWQELVVTALVTVMAYWISRPLRRANLNRIIINITNMFAAASVFFFTTWINFTSDIMCMLTAISLMFIPGVPLVNSMRNILCGNEMNGILEFLKVVLETLTICLGVFIAYALFGRWYTW